ncbi:MAG: bifunctional phosphoglucose/phosphomannose isomerase [Ignavibacteriae bacterium]|jgi:glucose/mannose-6-phosphate isomerase|nr:MAG: bifunctional phosphoglucose/phosphomannose isomerase [Ignavibacteriota bacterium]
MPKNPAPTIDKGGMFDVLYNFPKQIEQAVDIGESAPIWRQTAVSNRYAIFGLGGSAIGGDLLRSFASGVEWGQHLDISVHRGYNAPGWLDSDTNVIFSSYSGETEETLSAFDQARKKTMRMLTITTGGTLGKKSITAGAPIINIPTGFQPRCALAFAFFPLLTVMSRYGTFDAKGARMNTRGINETVRETEALRDLYASANAKNPAYALAKKLVDAYPVIYSANERMDAVNLRWRGQIQENAKHVAFGNLLPEMNHNEINGWQNPKGKTKPFHAILLRDPDDHARVKIRFDALKDIIKGSVGDVTTIEGTGKSLLSRMFTSIYMGDWVSYHLALLHQVDPTPVPVIMSLKAKLSKGR